MLKSLLLPLCYWVFKVVCIREFALCNCQCLESSLWWQLWRLFGGIISFMPILGLIWKEALVNWWKLGLGHMAQEFLCLNFGGTRQIYNLDLHIRCVFLFFIVTWLVLGSWDRYRKCGTIGICHGKFLNFLRYLRKTIRLFRRFCWNLDHFW